MSLRAFAPSLFAVVLALVVPTPVAAQSSAPGPDTGGAEYAPEAAAPAPAPGKPGAYTGPTVAGTKAKLLRDGTAAAPAAAPPQVQQAVWAANTLQQKPYVYGGGHASFKANGYDCSGTVSFALNAAGLLKSPLDSGSFMRWGESGKGSWITVYTHSGHAYVVIAGLRLDTSSAGVTGRGGRRWARSATERGPRWRPTGRPSAGFTLRHPAGL